MGVTRESRRPGNLSQRLQNENLPSADMTDEEKAALKKKARLGGFGQGQRVRQIKDDIRGGV